MSWKKFNINHNIKVKLNDKGYNHWLKNRNKMCKFNSKIEPTTIDELKEKEDKKGYIEFQMWCFMEIFGSEIGMGFENPCETNILIEF